MDIKGKHILIVEDHPLNRAVYQMALGFSGAQLVFDRWGRDVLVKLKMASHWDLIILDLMLWDGISGFDLFQEIRSLSEYDDVPIIAVSAAESSVAMKKARELGFNGFIAKPIDEERFPKQVVEILNGNSIWDDGISV